MAAEVYTTCTEASDMEVVHQDASVETVALGSESQETSAVDVVSEKAKASEGSAERDECTSTAEASDFQAEVEDDAEKSRASAEGAEGSDDVEETVGADASEQATVSRKLAARTSFLLAAAKASLEVTDSALEACPEDFVSASSESEDEEEATHQQFESLGDSPEDKEAEDGQSKPKSAGEDPEEIREEDTHQHFLSVGDSIELEQPGSESKPRSEERSDEPNPEAAKLSVGDNFDDAACSETTDATAGDAQAETDASNSDSDTGVPVPAVSSHEGQEMVPEQQEVRILHVQATLPQDIHFIVPSGCIPGQLLAVQGPHGPLHVQAPQGVKEGHRCTVRLAPPFQHEVLVPAGAVPGQKVTFFGENDEELEAIVPPGMKAGQVFHVSPPVVMVPVPTGAMKGDMLCFTTPKGQALMAPLPDDLSPGQYFPVLY